MRGKLLLSILALTLGHAALAQEPEPPPPDPAIEAAEEDVGPDEADEDIVKDSEGDGNEGAGKGKERTDEGEEGTHEGTQVSRQETSW